MDENNRRYATFRQEPVPEDVSPPRSVTINGRPHLLYTESISHNELVRLAYPDVTKVEFNSLTVSYRGGPLHAEEGLLGHHQRKRVANGEAFIVAATTAS